MKRFPSLATFAMGIVLVALAGASIAGCLDRELKPLNPCIVSGVVERVKVSNIEKVDLLFMVDNSNSMAEEQASLTAQFNAMIATLASGDIEGDGTPDFPAVKDLHFAVVYSCNSGTREVTENRAAPSFLNLLDRRGCDVAIGFAAQAVVRDGEPFERLATDLMSLGVPIEESARLAARAVYREKFLDRKGRLPSEAEIDEALAAQRHAVAQELATSLRVVRADGIPADEPLSPPRYGNATN